MSAEPLRDPSSPGPADVPSETERAAATNARLMLTKNPNNIDVLDHLTKLGALKQSGLLTQEEFELKRAELRGRLW